MSTNPQIAPGPIADFVASLNPMGIYDQAGLARAWQKIAPEHTIKAWPVHGPQETRQLKTVFYLVDHDEQVAYAYEVAMFICFALTGISAEEFHRRGHAGENTSNYNRKLHIWSASVDILERAGL